MSAPVTAARALRGLLHRDEVMEVPGIWDGMSALLAAEAGFEALFLSGGMLAFQRHGRPDMGLVGMSEVADQLALITERVDLPVIVDADTGFGNALNVQRTVAVFERAGAAGIQLEDQLAPKRCGHMAGKQVIATAEMVGKLKAARDAASRADTVIIARTDALAIDGFEATLARCDAYLAAGADVLFVEGPESVDQMKVIASQFADRVPLMHNLVEGGITPVHSARELADLGYRLALFPGTAGFAAVHAVRAAYADLRAKGDTRHRREAMIDLPRMNELTGVPEMMELSRRYGDA